MPQSYRAGKSTRRRAGRGSTMPLEERAKMLADHLWERAKIVGQALYPERPGATEALSAVEQWEILEEVAMQLSPMYWDRPDAIRELYRLRKEFSPGTAFESLLAYARARETVERVTPDPSLTPESPEFKKMARRLGIEGKV